MGYDELHIEWSGDAGQNGVVLLHGWGSSADVMRPLARALERNHRVANVDLPGHGRSPIPREPLDIAAHAILLGDLIRSEFGKPVDVIGHSNGGRIALWMASDPECAPLISRLALIAPSGIRARRGPKYYLRRSLAACLKAPFLLLPGRAREFGLDWLRHSLVWRLLGSADYRRLNGVMRELFVKAVNTYVEDRLPSITAPTLLFWGSADDQIGKRQIQTLEKHIADCGLVTIPDGTHYAHLDDPTTVTAALEVFLSSKDPNDE